MTDMISIHPRRPNLARILSWISPGLGHIYCGRFEAGLIFFIVIMSLFSLAPATLLLPGNLCQVGWIILIACLGLWWYASFDAARTAKKISPAYALKDYNRPSVYALFSFMALPIALGLAIFVRTTMLAAYYVPTDSMSPAIQKGERILVSKLIYREQPIRRGDIIVFLNPNRRYETNVKRVVALPGDHIEVSNGSICVNGAPVASYSKTFPATVVPNGACFVLAENPNLFEDSIQYGPVPLADIIGKVQWVYWPHWRRLS